MTIPEIPLPSGTTEQLLDPRATSDVSLRKLDALLENLAENPSPRQAIQAKHQNQLAQVRLGIASSLFTSLRIRHGQTAEHSLRVALGCSVWATAMGIPDEERDELEVAALLHDVGKIGIPDAVLRKPTSLTPDEARLMEAARQHSLEILSACCASPSLLNILRYAGTWHSDEFNSHSAPRAARMLAIVDAFDSMTTDQIYRKALPIERAVAELFTSAGTQFDPVLVHAFCDFQSNYRGTVTKEVASRWISELTFDRANLFWQLQPILASSAEPTGNSAATFYQSLMDNMHDGVIFVDPSCCVLSWNRGAENITGIAGNSIVGNHWSPSLVMLRDENGQLIPDETCPVREAIETRRQAVRRAILKERDGKLAYVSLHIIPVQTHLDAPLGASILIQDVSSEKDLKERVENLNERVTLDALTKVSNRAEFDRGFAESVERHLQLGHAMSLIICDIDRFKLINDTYGHQAGDEALITFAALLTRMSRKGDLVARYGGEEFVIVCDECGAAEATELADRVRLELSRTPMPSLNGNSITASFGVTEIQPGDSPAAMLNRADRGLLQAKDTGRNKVVQLGVGWECQGNNNLTSWWNSWTTPPSAENLIDCYLATNVPTKVAVEKLRGYIADHEAEIVTADNDHVALRLSGKTFSAQRRNTDRPMPFMVRLEFPDLSELPPSKSGPTPQTVVRVLVRPVRNRDRRHNPIEAARHVVSSLRAYLMAQEYQPSFPKSSGKGVLGKLSPWRKQ